MPRYSTALGIASILLLGPGCGNGPVDLSQFERSVFSQGGEDGVIEKLFEVIEPTKRFAVEFGAGDGVRLSNVRNLFVSHGWSGLLIEGASRRAERARRNYSGHEGVKVVHAWVFPGNVEALFAENGVPRDLDLLVIDIDSNDYYVWKVIHEFRPKVVLIEFNGSFAPPQRAVVEYHPFNYWSNTDYYGASIQSLYELGKRKGYELVYCTQSGINLFFVDGKYFRRLGIRDNSPAALYKPPQYGRRGDGRAPNGRGWRRFDAGAPRPLTFDGGDIPLKMVARPVRPAEAGPTSTRAGHSASEAAPPSRREVVDPMAP